MKFDDYSISHELKKNIAELGFKRPTDIQFKSIPPILKGEDVLAIAQTGTGKTAAFAIPIISILQEMKHSVRYEEGIKCIVLEPTRELALQVTEVFQKMAKGTKVETLCLFGGVDQTPQVDKIAKGVDILIATPGRMFDLIYQKHLKITGVEILVLDEADHMLDLGFIKDIQDVKKFLPKFHQTLFFSATINEQIKKVAYSLVRNAIRIQLSPNDPVAKNIKHSVAFVEMDDKRFFLERVVNENPESKILVFVRTKVRAERVKSAMQRVGIESETIHGDKEQLDRLSVLDKFRSGEVKILIATDVSARGIDIANVDYVVNYDLPDVPENYVHRVGRTGRGMQKGLAVSFCATEEKPILDEIEGFMGKKIRVLELDKQEYNETIDFSKDTTNYDLNALLKEAEEFESSKKKTKKKKK
ncbi:DEAD/DEAH box helicase [Emticicia oligotrophica]|uniref:DEAD/DEAH box helicase n=1 Tax=Emticicia oligotrophica TaxID=312279 RepID=UPI00273B98B0|nr:DEAD/DEAH box helicase [Emticicia oligotrophica]